MSKKAIALVSITYAQKAKEILRKSNVSAKIIRLNKGQNQNGCAFGLEIYEKDFSVALQILRTALIMFTEVY